MGVFAPYKGYKVPRDLVTLILGSFSVSVIAENEQNK